jgi:ABC-type amino acid transport substrate-binding protein
LAVVVGVAAVHVFRVGSHLPGPQQRLYYSYASDLLLPLAMYFVLCLSERNIRVLADWKRKTACVLAAASAAEALQGLGVPMLGRTFDPLDFVMYAVGVLTAVVLDRVVLAALCDLRVDDSDPGRREQGASP